MKKIFVLALLMLSVLVLAVNSPKQPLLFFNIDDSIKDYQNFVRDALKTVIYENIDSETNFKMLDSRFSYNFYPEDAVREVEVAVVAARIFGVEDEILKDFPLSSPTFEDVKSKLEKLYVNDGYDFSRDFGYMEYMNNYFIKKLGVPLFDSINPLNTITKLDMIKYFVKIFTLKALENNWSFGPYIPMTSSKNLVTYAEELNRRLSVYTGIQSPAEAGYLTVFEKYFLTNDKGKIVPLIKYFDQTTKIDAYTLVSRAYFYTMVSYLFTQAPVKIPDNAKIPVRTYNNMISYLPKKSLEGEYALFEPLKPNSGKIKILEPYNLSNDIIKFNIDNGNEIITLDNSKIYLHKKFYVENIAENTYVSKRLKWDKKEIFDGKDFALRYKSLATVDNNSKKFEFSSFGTIEKNGNEIWIKNISHVFKPTRKNEKLPVTLKLTNKFKIANPDSFKIKWYTVNVDTIEMMKKLAEYGFEGIPEKYKVLFKEVNASKVPAGIGVMFNTEVDYIYRNKVIKNDYINGNIAYYFTKDRLNVKRDYATFKSLKDFLEYYQYGYEKVDYTENTDFLDYWNEVKDKLNDMKISDKAYFVPDARITLDIVEEKFIQRPEDMNIFFWTFYGGKLVSFEPATHRLFTQKFVEPFKYADDAIVYVKYKDGTIKSGKINGKGKDLFLNDSKEYLRDLLLWFQVSVKKDKKGEKQLEIVYIIAEEI
ncbi:hypothetical protein XO10_05220 [Marinitoga sp. 1135]|uniref:SLH domain-containing protein n=1 Tax=Marinitoga piezophila (strain DSM 14283 / JCM 11233 / KA3) TaxID=443254 RepID=H2J7X6_MARPK|nr:MULTISPECIES: hypothetical protein [Marinitoga]AEX85467.1 hypothetical protein Marpi_1055 [Marinitoga piezophila KA3]NUU95684.1 hypothetical protein [Marinitoga sp. 1135]NUU97616.1 hypothetical protein [Marinitoga sp. 1138]